MNKIIKIIQLNLKLLNLENKIDYHQLSYPDGSMKISIEGQQLLFSHELAHFKQIMRQFYIIEEWESSEPTHMYDDMYGYENEVWIDHYQVLIKLP